MENSMDTWSRKPQAPDLDVILWTINMVKKKLCSVISLPRACSLDPEALAKLQILDRKLFQLQSFLDEYHGLKMNPSDHMVKYFLEVKHIVHLTEDFVEDVDCEVLHSKSESFGISIGEVSVSFPNVMELDNNELEGNQSGANRKRKFPYTYVQEMIGMVDDIVGRAKEVPTFNLPSGNQKCKRGKGIHERNISKTDGELSDQMHGLFLKHATGMGSDPNVLPGVLSQKAEKLGGDLDSLIRDFKGIEHGVTYPDIPRRGRIAHADANQIVVGRSKDVNNNLRILFSESDRSRSGISVQAVTGMGGLGKTTLAQLVYNNPKVQNHFDISGWVCVSTDFNVLGITSMLLECFACKAYHSPELGSLQRELSHLVTGKRFFLVLDDVWNEDQSLWEALMSPLYSAQFGYVIVTTRSIEVARIVQTTRTYSLGSLSYEDSFSLFENIAFKDRSNESFACENDALTEEKRKKIVKRLIGNPLAIKLIGGVFRANTDTEIWEKFINLEPKEIGYDIMPALKVSYDMLPPILKLFFTMFSLFPKDHVFSKGDVTKFWLALDFVQSESNQSLEDIANSYFEGLVNRNFIEQNLHGTKKKGFIMHDLLHDLAQLLAGEEFVRAEAGEELAVRSNSVAHSKYGVHSRYVSIIVNKLPKVLNLLPLQDYHQLRLLQIINKANKWNNRIRIDLSDEQFQFLRHLRILDLRYTGIEDLPSSIGNLKQLRYLNLTKTNISKLPESITYLCYLKTLELKGCPLRELPQGITNLVNLEHLNFFDKNTCMPRGIGRLTKLQTLPVFCIKKGNWHCEISELQRLINLQGELTIIGLRIVSSAEGAKQANLQSKNLLEVLTLDWSNAAHTNCDHYKVYNFEATNSDKEQYDNLELGNIEIVFENLQPNFGLKELNIINYSGSRFPNWFGDVSFSQLSKISLNGCGENCKVLPTLGLLPSLKSLYISWMYNFQFIGREFCSPNSEIKGFQSLETLEFKYIPNWVQWFGVQNGEFCRLSALRIVCCNELRFLPQTLSSSLTKLLINNCKELSKLSFLPSLTRLTLSGELSESLLSNLQSRSLQFLNIACTENIKYLLLSEWKVPSLLVLVIKGCKHLQFIAGIKSITTLKRLEIVRCHSVQISSDEEIPPTLQHLTIVRCHWLQYWYQVISVKYRDQLKSSLELERTMEDSDHEKAVEETRTG